MEPKEIIERNSEEIVVEEELVSLLESDERERAYIGYEPSGPPHIGHWLSARKLMDAETAGFEPVVLWADLHAINNQKGDPSWGREKRLQWLGDMSDLWQATFEELGLEDADYNRGLDFQLEPDYTDDFHYLTSLISESRTSRAMSEIASESDSRKLSQFNYPVLQMNDIAHLDIDLAIGGTDQRRIHMLAREYLPEIGHDKPVALHLPLLTSLKGGEKKMSSSEPQTMFPLYASPEMIENRISDAYCPTSMDDVKDRVDSHDDWHWTAEDLEDMTVFDANPLLQLSKYFVFGADKELKIQRPEEYGGETTYKFYEQLETDFQKGELHPQDLKTSVANHMVDRLEPVRSRFADEKYLLDPIEELGYDIPDVNADSYLGSSN